MVGNDIVDLNEAELNSNWQHNRFLDKLFTQNEQKYIRESSYPFIAIWQFWSMKEAAYKLYTQLYPSRFYNPKAFECTAEKNGGLVNYLGASTRGIYKEKDLKISKQASEHLNLDYRVTFKTFKCYVQTIITSDYILSGAQLSKQELSSKVLVFDSNDYKTQSVVLKQNLIKQVSKYVSNKNQNVCIVKDNLGIPKLKINEQLFSVSFTHHGTFGAFAVESNFVRSLSY